MYPTLYAHAPHVSRNGLVSSDWIMDGLRSVRDALQTEGREPLARTLSEVLGGLSVQPRTLLDDGPDFEVSEPLGQGDEWPSCPSWCDDHAWTTTEPTPLEVLGDEYEDFLDSMTFADHAAEIAEGGESDSRFDEADARAAGLAV